jgi:hypothetical protein
MTAILILPVAAIDKPSYLVVTKGAALRARRAAVESEEGIRSERRGNSLVTRLRCVVGRAAAKRIHSASDLV